MPKNDGKARSWRKPLKDVSNGAKSSKPLKKKVPENEDRIEDDGHDTLDRLLLVQSNLSTLIGQIDELVVQAFKIKATGRQGRKEIESFMHVLSEMLSSLKPWVPRFQKAVSSPAMEAENQLGQTLAGQIVPAVNENARNVVDSPEPTKLDSLISPSPLVSWRADCTIERGRQLFLLTPLPMSKALSARQQGSYKSVFERITYNADAGLPSFCTISEGANDDLLEGVETKPTPNKCSEPGTTELGNSSKCGFDSPPRFSQRDCSMLVVTPCLKMSPPKSCVLLEPISEYSHQDNDGIRKSTPFSLGIQHCNGLEISESPSSLVSKSLASKYPELFGIKPAHKVGIRKKEVEASLDWFMSPPKTCVLMEPPDEKYLNNAATYCNLLKAAPVLQQQMDVSSVKGNDVQGICHLTNNFCNKELGGTSAQIESTPMWREPESTIRMGKCPGETTLKKELWTKFEAASTNGPCLNISVLQQTAQKKFLDRLDEVSCVQTDSETEGLR